MCSLSKNDVEIIETTQYTKDVLKDLNKKQFQTIEIIFTILTN